MHPIDPSNITSEIKKSDSETGKEIENKVNSAAIHKARIAIGQILKQTLPELTQKGLQSVNSQKAVLNAKQILPGAYTQAYIENKVVQQNKIAADIKTAQMPIVPSTLTHATVRQWITGQFIQAIVYQQTENGFAALLVNARGQFDSKTLAQITPPGTDLAKAETLPLQIKIIRARLTQLADSLVQIQTTLKQQSPLDTAAQSILETSRAQIHKAAQTLQQTSGSKQTTVTSTININTETLHTPIKTAIEILKQVTTQLALIQSSAMHKIQLPIQNIAELLSKVTRNLSQSIAATTPQTAKTEPGILANTAANNKIIQQAQLLQVKTELALQPGQQLLVQVKKKAAEISLQIQHPPLLSHKISQQLNQHSLRQQAMPPLLASLKEISSQVNQAKSSFTPQFIKQVDKLIQQFPQLTDLSGVKTIKNTIMNSGQFLENKLFTSIIHAMKLSDTQSRPITKTLINQLSQADLKVNLAHLAAMIHKNEALVLPKSLLSESALYKSIAQKTTSDLYSRFAQAFDLPNRVTHAQVQAPAADANLLQLNSLLVLQSKLSAQLEGVLSRMIATQLNARETRTDQPQLNIEIPFRISDQQEVLQLKIREEKKQSEADKGNKIWTANMAFHLPSLGGIRIYITLEKQDLAMQFWTEEKNTQQLFQNHSALLSERLFAVGFNISQFSVFHGIPDAAKEEQKSGQFIVDEKV